MIIKNAITNRINRKDELLKALEKHEQYSCLVLGIACASESSDVKARHPFAAALYNLQDQ